MKYLLLSSIFCCCTCSVIAQAVELVPEKMDTVHVKISPANYKGKKAVRVIGTNYEAEEIAILKNISFTNGAIELDVSGDRLPETDINFRGFIGIAFRLQQTDSLRYECFYLRPTNARAEDQLQKNHSTQYISFPNFPWPLLRKETPGVYESYSDLVPGEWTHIKIIVKDKKASLFVNNASQACLIVNDLKNGITTGTLALWIGPGTDGYFSNLTISKEK